MKKLRGKLRFLSFRVLATAWACLFGLLLLLVLEMVCIGKKRDFSIVLIFTLLLAVVLTLIFIFWIYRPFQRDEMMQKQFLDGYMALGQFHKMGEKSVLTPGSGREREKIGEILMSGKLFTLNKRQAQYLALQNQINPHFLYNTLDGIRSEALIAGVSHVAEMTEALAAYFRYTISKVENLVTVDEELKNCEIYFKIQQYRFGDRIRLVIDCKEEDEGEIMGLLTIGANGLPAFLKILSEYPPLYHGYIYYREKLVDSWVEGHQAIPRISMIGDTSSLVEGQSVLTNIMILRRGFGQNILNFKLLNRQLQPFLEETGISLNPALPVEKLTAFERIVVEILRGVVADHRLIVVQEISAIINERQLKRLYEIMRYYAKKGFSFLYISNDFEEQIQICDCVALMMHQRITKILRGEEMSKEVVKLFCPGGGMCGHTMSGAESFQGIISDAFREGSPRGRKVFSFGETCGVK